MIAIIDNLITFVDNIMEVRSTSLIFISFNDHEIKIELETANITVLCS